jgi:2-polyprenyl-6-methoxyphenol hydroxylase-like FAD-dependent oxidoreductase
MRAWSRVPQADLWRSCGASWRAILYEATRGDAQYLFEDSITTLVEEPDGVTVTFEHAPADRFDLVIGADGLHSTVRGLA